MSDITGALVIDSGNGFIKAGLAQNDFPTVCTPNVLLEAPEGTELEKGAKWYGQDALKKYTQSALPEGERPDKLLPQDRLQLTRPSERGNMTNWDA
jgi:actin-related protein